MLNKAFKNKKGITLIALIITIIVLLILAGVTIAAITSNESTPNKAVEARQKNDIGAAKDDISLTATNAKLHGMETVYVSNGRLAENTSTTVGTEVIKAVVQKYQTNNQIGKATIEIEDFGTVENITGDATISVSTTDFEVIGTIALEDGNLTWGEIELNVPAVVDRVELNPTTLDIEQGGSGTVEVKCYNSSNNLIPTRKLTDISIAKKSGSNNITVTQDAKNKNFATITVSESETVGTGNAVITATAGGVEAITENQCTINVKKKVPLIGQYVEYNISYTDMYVSDIDTATEGNQGFTAINGWRILEPGTKSTLNGETIYTGTKIISTGVPALLRYSDDTNTNASNTWWDLSKTNANEKAASGLEHAKIETSTAGVYRGFESIIFEPKSNDLIKNKGGYIEINGITSGDLTGEVFKTSQADSVATLTESDLDTALTTLNGNTKKGSSMRNLNLFYLKNLNSGTDNFNYGSASPVYYLASYGANSAYGVKFVNHAGEVGANRGSFGVRPVVTLSSDVYIKKVGDIWKIFNVTNP